MINKLILLPTELPTDRDTNRDSPMISRLVLVLVVCIATFKSGNGQLKAKAYQSVDPNPKATDFPERELLKGRSNVAIGFSGGGSRAYTGAMGYLAALEKLDLMKRAQYVGGISGGAWATTTYTFAQGISDDVLLGDVVLPEDISLLCLQKMDPKCARSLASGPMSINTLKYAGNGTTDGMAAGWNHALFTQYLEPVGISENTRFSWNADTVNDIKARNPSLANEIFLLPANENRPFSLIATSLVGPTAASPFRPKAQNYTLLEITPLYVGQFKNLDVEYHSAKGASMMHHVGGAIESFAFSRQSASPVPTTGLAPSQASAVLEVPEPDYFIDLAYAAGASGYAPGAFFESLPEGLSSNLGMVMDYWSPSQEVQDTSSSPTFMYGDGGSFENIPLINFMQREVTNIVLFFMCSAPMLPRDQWNPWTDPISEDQITKSIPAFFGLKELDKEPHWEDRSYELERDQVFRNEDYPVLIDKLQKAQAVGSGIIATMNLTTVANEWWGIPEGKTFSVTFSYMGRLQAWEQRLSPEMYKLVVPEDASDMAALKDSGPFKHFPHYPTLGGLVDTERANLLADFTGFSVLDNEGLFREIFQ